MTREEVEEVLGPPRSSLSLEDVHYSAPAGVGLNFDHAGRLIYVEISWDDISRPSAFYKDFDVFTILADNVVAHIAQDAEPIVREHGAAVLFPSLDLALWRPVLPSDYAEGAPEDEYRNGKYWMTVGIGQRGNLSRLL